MARNEQLIRQHRILQILERSRFGRKLEEIRDDIVDELGLSSLHTRSVRRDLEALQAAGLDLDVHDTPRGRVWKLGPRFQGAHRISASATELMALSLGRDLMLPLAGTPFWLGIESFWSKVRDGLPAGVWAHYEKYRRILHVLGMPAKSYRGHEGMLKTIHRAILEHRVLQIDYQSLGQDQPSRRKLEPYGVVLYKSSLYVVADACGASAGTQRVRHLKLDRFRSATALDEWFRPRSDFQLDQHLGRSIGIFSGGEVRNFRIRISAYAAPWVREDPWHADQQVTPQADGSLILTVRAAHELEIIPRVLALGTEAELLSPASCRRAIAGIVGQLAAMYREE